MISKKQAIMMILALVHFFVNRWCHCNLEQPPAHPYFIYTFIFIKENISSSIILELRQKTDLYQRDLKLHKKKQEFRQKILVLTLEKAELLQNKKYYLSGKKFIHFENSKTCQEYGTILQRAKVILKNQNVARKFRLQIRKINVLFRIKYKICFKFQNFLRKFMTL